MTKDIEMQNTTSMKKPKTWLTLSNPQFISGVLIQVENHHKTILAIKININVA
jgi:hypothetical protein